MIKNIIVEGVDRLGKDSLIQGLQHELGYFQVLHFQKPQVLEFYYDRGLKCGLDAEDSKKFAQSMYQKESFKTLFAMLSDPRDNAPKIICNRAHLGEVVYSKRYRNYDGEYVFEIEEYTHFQRAKSNTLLVLLTTSDFSFIGDDGLSFDVTKREEEQEDFIKAFNNSKIKNKLLIDVNDNGKFVDRDVVLNKVVSYISAHNSYYEPQIV